MPLLRVRDISLSFGGIHVLRSVGLDADAGEVVAVIGPNGAGKSSLLNVLAGSYRPTSGTVDLAGLDLLRTRPHRLAKAGVVRSFQNLGVFGDLSVVDNLLLGAHARTRGGVLAGGVVSRRARADERAARTRADEVVAILGLGEVTALPVGLLPYGTQKRVEIGRCLMSEPRLLLLDEPVAGMSVAERQGIADVVRTLRERGLAIVLVEHDLPWVTALADRVIALNHGEKIAEGPAHDVQRDPAVVEAYLGTAPEVARA